MDNNYHNDANRISNFSDIMRVKHNHKIGIMNILGILFFIIIVINPIIALSGTNTINTDKQILYPNQILPYESDDLQNCTPTFTTGLFVTVYNGTNTTNNITNNITTYVNTTYNITNNITQNMSVQDIKDLGFNLSSELTSLYNGLYYSISNPLNFVNLTQIITSIGNWSSDKPNYYNTTQIDSNMSSLNNSLNAEISHRQTNDTALNNSLVWQNGTWTQLKAGITQNVNVSNVLFVNGSNVGIGMTTPASPLEIKGTNVGTPTASLDLMLGSNLENSPQDIRIKSNTGAIRIISSPNALTTTPDGASFQLWGTASALPGQAYFDSGSHNSSAVVFRTAITGGTITERMRITSAGNIGIGTTAPNQKLEVNGGIRFNTTTAKPTCDSTQRGTFWVTQGAAGVKDIVEVCAKDASDSYAWRTIY